MGEELKEDTSYIYQGETTHRKTLRQMKRKHYQNYSLTNDRQKLIHDNKHTLNNSDLSVSAFSPAIATSTPIKSDMVGEPITIVPQLNNEDVVTAQLLQFHDLARESNNEISVNNISQAISTSKFQQQKDEYVPIAKIENIFPKIKDEESDVNGLSKEKIFEVPNSLIAYIYDEGHQHAHKMQIIQLNTDVSTYQVIKPIEKDSQHIIEPTTICQKDFHDITSSRMGNTYRQTASKWKSFRHKLQ